MQLRRIVIRFFFLLSWEIVGDKLTNSESQKNALMLVTHAMNSVNITISVCSSGCHVTPTLMTLLVLADWQETHDHSSSGILATAFTLSHLFSLVSAGCAHALGVLCARDVRCCAARVWCCYYYRLGRCISSSRNYRSGLDMVDGPE